MFVCGKSNQKHELFVKRQESLKVRLTRSSSRDFSCNNGLRQGENLSPFLFSLYLNDLEDFMNMNNVHGLDSISADLETDFNLYIKIFILLYADDTILFSESKEDLQLQLDIFHEYYSIWKLKVNINKTKAMIFSRAVQMIILCLDIMMK